MNNGLSGVYVYMGWGPSFPPPSAATEDRDSEKSLLLEPLFLHNTPKTIVRRAPFSSPALPKHRAAPSEYLLMPF